MTRQPVQSSNLRTVGYDSATMTLEVEFQPKKNGEAQVWQYSPVSRETFDQIVDPNNSAGAVFHAAVRSNRAIKAMLFATYYYEPEGLPTGLPS